MFDRMFDRFAQAFSQYKVIFIQKSKIETCCFLK